MVADFISADHGWLFSPDGQKSARRLFKAGKSQDGWFTNDDIIGQLQDAMDILDQFYPDEEHVFVYDNATTHLKRADDALSARRMPKFPTRPDNPMFGVERAKLDTDGKPVYNTKTGKVVKEKVQMTDAQLPDGSPQCLYFPDGHPRAGTFKGMAILLKERGFHDADNIRAECAQFRCPDNNDRCCCRRLLYNQPDFTHVDTLLETTCKSRGYRVLFLPKFHCELNFIEMCWGHAKRSRRFMDAYRKRLNGKQAAWAAKKYHGHRQLPASIMEELDKESI
ncbi:hypothetical protein PUNSTDRAFT_115955 [Punctularia strigosozonata HHB-11173 SS5]|uniref:uncharacterized protein n=1 Tax=Punctularia strigosozonata (strain HHB-11173) TaxID=741275 RepID=UPI0004417E7F|nr:uncharacterized protein PUNSTDRAFT_115955 [Punctularia strigosozonata HHB-11173 SS5]EIN05547.1 hypothetical protein PUNSTDRAFT_115955 [Punctularia strigosozonata HHB-11173 SS5]